MLRAVIVIYVILFNIAFVENNFAQGLYIEELITSTITGHKISAHKKIYFSNNNILFIDPLHPHKVVFNFKTQKGLLIDDSKRRYSSLSFENFKEISDHGIYSVFNSTADDDIVCRKSGHFKKIGNYNCFEVVIYIPRIAVITSLWLTSEISAPLGLLYSASQKAKSGLGIANIFPIMKKHNAYVVESNTKMFRPKEQTKYLNVRLKEISSRDIPDSLFAIPEGYENIPYSIYARRFSGND